MRGLSTRLTGFSVSSPVFHCALNARLGDFPIHVAAQIGGNTAQLHVQPVAGAAAGQTEEKINPRLFQRMMLSNDAAGKPLPKAAIDLGAPIGAILLYAFPPDAGGGAWGGDTEQGGGGH